MSFCDYDVINKAQWVGLDNYKYFFQDEIIPKSIWNTLFMVLSIPLGMALSLAVALLLNSKIRLIGFWRTVYYLPAIIPAVAAFMLWAWIYNPIGGLFNQCLDAIGIEGPNWLGSETWSKPSLLIIGLWGAGGWMLIWLAGLKNIPAHYYEAASIDGASKLKQFIHITLPMLTPYIFFNVIMGVITVLQIFDISYIMTRGGPANSTLFYVYHLFNNAFRYLNMGYASAMAWFLFVIILILTIIQLNVAKYWVHYEGD
jgi:multiple sugar transport system permease protein